MNSNTTSPNLTAEAQPYLTVTPTTCIKELNEFLGFSGELHGQHEATEVRFRARVNKAGEVEFDFDPVPFRTGRFIYKEWQGNGPHFGYFRVRGATDNGISIETDDLHFGSVTTRSVVPAELGLLKASCSQALFRRTLSKPTEKPMLLTRVKAFHTLGALFADTPLGRVVMDGTLEEKEHNAITGYIAVEAPDADLDANAWRADAERLLNHLARIMSLGTATNILRPITEFFVGDTLEVQARSQVPSSKSVTPAIDKVAQQPLFDCAVKCFFEPPYDTKGLFYALEWLAINATYGEIRLLTAMTALETLLDANLDVRDRQIQPSKEFERTRRKLRQVIRQCLNNADTQAVDEIVSTMNEKLPELNRKSFISKIQLLGDKWNVSMAGIASEEILAAKRARDRVVHRGHFYDDDTDRNNDDLWTHGVLVREIAVRFLLTSIGYRGQYISWIGGFHHSKFPPEP